jgi:hypothetical protein
LSHSFLSPPEASWTLTPPGIQVLSRSLLPKLGEIDSV